VLLINYQAQDVYASEYGDYTESEGSTSIIQINMNDGNYQEFNEDTCDNSGLGIF